MALDGLFLHALTYELQHLKNGRITKIHQPTSFELVFQIRTQGQNHRLLVSANPTYPRLYLTRQTFRNPLSAPMFCMLLRKHCEQGIIESIRQVGLERIIYMDIRQRDELGDLRTKRLVIELMGRHSNIILIDPQSEQIFGSIQHVTPDMSRYRTVLPGSTYKPPPEQNKTDPLSVNETELNDLLQTIDGQLEPRDLVSLFTGLSPLNAREIGFRAVQMDKNGHSLSDWTNAILETAKQIRTHEYRPQIVEQQGKKSVFSILELTHMEGDVERFDQANDCLEAYFSEKAARDAVRQKSSSLMQILQNELQKNVKKIKILEQTIKDAQDADRYRNMGELLIAHLHEVKRGDSEIEVMNFYDPNQAYVTISLDPQLTPSENAQRLFRRYNKLKNSVTHAQTQLKRTKQELAYLEQLRLQIEEASLSDLEEIKEELIKEGYIQNKQKHSQRKRKNTRPNVLKYTSSEGIPIYVGKNNIQNEYLTNRLAHADDTWLHTKDIPGSHVVIRSKDFSETTLHEAAMLAAYYSKGKDSSQVPVDYTLIRHVRKPSGAKPGFVIYEQQKTLYVTPERNIIRQLPSSSQE